MYQNAWQIETKVKVMDIREIYAEKIRAASTRARYRDFYDLTLLLSYFKFDLKEITQLIQQKEIRKPITQVAILQNWRMAKKEKQGELSRIYYAQNVSDQAVEETIKKLKIHAG